jgi:hypothetical protein
MLAPNKQTNKQTNKQQQHQQQQQQTTTNNNETHLITRNIKRLAEPLQLERNARRNVERQTLTAQPIVRIGLCHFVLELCKLELCLNRR